MMRAVLLPLLCSVMACTSGSNAPDPDPVATRTYRLGFSAIPPRLDITVLLQALEIWARRSDAAIFHLSVPWRGLLADSSAAVLIRKDQLELAQLYRTRGLRVVVTIDPTDGLNRTREDTALTAHGRSIAQPAIQALYRDYVVTLDSLLHPDYLGLAAETNLIRAIAPAPPACATARAGRRGRMVIGFCRRCHFVARQAGALDPPADAACG